MYFIVMRVQQQNLRSGRQYANKIQQGHHPSYSSIPRGPAPTCFRAFAHRESGADTGSVQSAEYSQLAAGAARRNISFKI